MKNITMNAEMTKAILDGRKTQTRRVGITNHGRYIIDDNLLKSYKLSNQDILKCGKYQKGEVIWVREPAKIVDFDYDFGDTWGEYLADGKVAEFELDDRFQKDGDVPKWVANRQGIPNGCIKEMARIFLKITDVRIERLQDISTEDIKKEGFRGMWVFAADSERGNRKKFKDIWNKTVSKGYKWEDNPFVFVYEFERVTNETI